MTALAIVCRDDCIVMGSDGAIVDASGVLIGYRSKVLLLPESSTVIGFRGHVEVADVVASHLRAMFGFDSILSVAAPALEVATKLVRAKTGDEAVNLSMIIGGYSVARDAFQAYRIGTRPYAVEAGKPPAPPFTLSSISPAYAAPMPSPEACARFGVRWDGTTLEDDSHLVLRLISAARTERCEPDDGGAPVSHVGGFLQLTTLKQGVVDSRIVHGWHDARGETIESSRGDALPPFLDPGKIARNEAHYTS